MQRHLQLRIEAQGKYLQTVLEKAQETVGRQNLGAVDLETAKIQLSELVSKVSTYQLNSTFSRIKDNQPTDNSPDSCLTYCEGQQMDQNIISLNFLKSKKAEIELENAWCEDTKRNKKFLSSSDLSMSVGHESSEWKAKSENVETSQKYRFPYFEQKLDLNARDENDAASSRKQLDLNGLSW